MSYVKSIKQPAMARRESSQLNYHGSVYYRARSLLLLAPSLVLTKDDKTLDRQSFRLLIASNAPFQLTLNDGRIFEEQAILLSPQVGKFSLSAIQSNIALFDFTVASPEYGMLARLTANEIAHPMSLQRFEHMLDALIKGQDGILKSAEVTQLMDQAVHLITGEWPKPLQYEERIMAAIRMIESLPLTDISVKQLADVACLSPDRFRHLFKEVTGCTVSNYARSTAVWRAMQLLDKGLSVTEISHQIGFHDVSHLYHAFSKQFGISLSDKLNPRKFRRIRCV